MAGSRIRKRNIQDDPGGFYSAGKKVLHRKKKKAYVRGHRRKLKELPLAQTRVT